MSKNAKNIQEYVSNNVIEYLNRERWVIVKVEHGDVYGVHIEFVDTKTQMLKRVRDLFYMVKGTYGTEDIIEEHKIGEHNQSPEHKWTYWSEDGKQRVVSIDARLIN